MTNNKITDHDQEAAGRENLPAAGRENLPAAGRHVVAAIPGGEWFGAFRAEKETWTEPIIAFIVWSDGDMQPVGMIIAGDEDSPDMRTWSGFRYTGLHPDEVNP